MEFPYQRYENSRLWNVIDEAVSALVANNDLRETTARNYVVGYLCRQLEEAKLVATNS